MRVTTRLLFAEDRVKRAMMKAAAGLGFKKYKDILEGPTPDMTNDRVSRSLMLLYVYPENYALRKWMKLGRGKTYLDVGAGSGRFTKIALETDTERVVGVDTNPKCIDVLKKRFGSDRRFEAVYADARKLHYADDSFDRVMALGNVLGNVFETFPGGERSFQLEVLGEMFRVAKEEIVFTVHQKGNLRESLKYYRMNGFDVYAYDNGIVRWRERIGPELEQFEGRSQKFSKQEVEKLLTDAGIPLSQVEVRPIIWTNWMVKITKG